MCIYCYHVPFVTYCLTANFNYIVALNNNNGIKLNMCCCSFNSTGKLKEVRFVYN